MEPQNPQIPGSSCRAESGNCMSSRPACIAAVGILALCLYLNTLPAGFTFDDNFAVVRPLSSSVLRQAALHSLRSSLTDFGLSGACLRSPTQDEAPSRAYEGGVLHRSPMETCQTPTSPFLLYSATTFGTSMLSVPDDAC